MSGSAQPASRRPLYAQALRLRHIRPGGLLCFLYFEGSLGLAVLLALAELVSWWAVIVLPVLVAVMVKLNDLVAGAVQRSAQPVDDGALGIQDEEGDEEGEVELSEATDETVEIEEIEAAGVLEAPAAAAEEPAQVHDPVAGRSGAGERAAGRTGGPDGTGKRSRGIPGQPPDAPDDDAPRLYTDEPAGDADTAVLDLRALRDSRS